MIINVLQRLIPAGVVDMIFTMGSSVKFNNKFFSHNAASAEVDLFLRDDLKDLRPFLLKRLMFFYSYKGKKNEMNQPPRPGNKPVTIR